MVNFPSFHGHFVYVPFWYYNKLLKLLMSFKTSHPSDPSPEIFHIVLQHEKQMLRNSETTVIALRMNKTKWFWEKSAIL